MSAFGRLFALGVVLFTLVACWLPEEVKKNARALPGSITAAEQYVAESRKKLEATLTAEEEFRPYAMREDWAAKFTEATSDLFAAKKLVDGEVAQLLKRDDSDDTKKLTDLTDRVSGMVKRARETASFPSKRLAFLQEAKTHYVAYLSEANQLGPETASAWRDLAAYADRMKQAYPAKQDAIGQRVREAEIIFEANERATRMVVSQASFAPGAGLDYAILGDGYTTVKASHAAMRVVRPKVEKKLGELDQSYSRILVDMKAIYTVCVTRVSWEESEVIEWPKETSFDYPCKEVSDDAFETAEDFDERDKDFVWHGKDWWGTWNTAYYTTSDATKEDAAELWRELGLDPRESWPRGDNEATFYIHNTAAHFFHRYIYIESGVKRDGGWEEVPPEFYETHEAHLGLALKEKPIGSFEEDSVTVPSPIGLAHVGNEKMGHWESRGGVSPIWIWYTPYSSYNGYYGPGWGGYTRNDVGSWNAARAQGKVYTGASTTPMFGTVGTATSSGQFAQSEFAQRGGFREAAQAARGAGPAGRAGGPGGSGK